MYSVSNAFKEQMKSPIQEHKITGTIGSVSFDEANIVEGSFSISNQSTDTNDVVLGSCYVGQLTAEFTGINIEYGKWINKTITLSFGLKVGEYYEYVPLGVYKVKEAKHTDHGVQVTAYDNMIKFDKKFRKSHYMNLSGMTNIIDQLCLDAGVICGMSHAEIEALPNGDRTGINIYGSTGKKAEFANDITTLRDLLFWVAQTMGCFATIDRAGQLVFRQYTQNVVDVITNEHRIAGATFEDYITHYIGIYVENLDDNTEDYYGYDATALQQELTETMAEITEDQEDITDLELDRADWVQKLANHECTQQEYDAAIAEIDAQEKALTKEINQLSKRAEWLSNAIAQSADDGSDMVLGANPLVMAKNLTTRDQQRREILTALDAISYTPFTASVICGAHYDLGDVIQWSGGLYNSETDSFGCVMSWNYNHNGGTELEGFGVDPAVQLVRTKTQKSADRANANAKDSTRNTFDVADPTDPQNPVSGKNGDTYYKKGTAVNITPKYAIDHRSGKDGWADEEASYQGQALTFTRPSDMAEVKNFAWGNDGYSFSVAGQIYAFIRSDQIPNLGANGYYGVPVFAINIREEGYYKIKCKAKYTCGNPNNPMQAPILSVFTNSKMTNTGIPTNPEQTVAFPQGDTYGDFEAICQVTSGMLNEPIYMWLKYWWAIFPSEMGGKASINISVKDLLVEKVVNQQTGETDGGINTETSEYIDKTYVNTSDGDSRTASWKEVEYVQKVDDSTDSGLSYDRPTETEQKTLTLKPNVMRAWYKADPPQIERDFSQFCVRYTGSPDKQIQIAPSANHTWRNVKVTKDDDSAYKIKCSGSYDSESINYVVYAIGGLVQGKKYYFNFKCNFSDNAKFAYDMSIGCGIVFNDTGVLSTGNYSGDEDTFDETNKYYAFRRRPESWYADFGFTATASTMYMCILMQAMTDSSTVSFTLSELVISQKERQLIRNIYLYDYTAKDWLKYKPFTGSVSGGDDGGSVVAIEPTLSQGIKIADFSIDGIPGELYAPDNEYELPIATEETLGGIKVGQNLNIEEDGTLNASAAPSTVEDLTDVDVDTQTLADGQVLRWDSTEEKWVNEDESDGSQAIELTKAQYDALPSAEKNDPNKVYYVPDYPTPSGIDLDDIDNVDLSSPADGQVLKYDATNDKWINANESGGGTPSMSDWGWSVLHKTVEWTGGFAPDDYRLVSYIEFVKPSSMIGKMVIVQGVHVYGSTDGTTFNDTLDFDLHYVYNRTNQSDEEVVYIGGLMHNHSSVTYTHVKFSANVIYI